MQSDKSKGIAALVTSAVMWGCFPLYWNLLGFTGALDVLANRVVFSLIFGFVILRAIDGRFMPIRINTQQFLLITAASIGLSLNWGISIYAVESARVVEAGIGMYFAPIFQIIFGAVAFKETLNRTKILVTILMAISLGFLIFDLGQFPVIALVMGLSFASYASLKKMITLSPRDSFIYEASVMLIPALLYISIKGSALTAQNFTNTYEIFLLIGAGLIAAPPLVLYGYGAQKSALSTSGMTLNFIPIISILIAVFVLDERFSKNIAISTGLITTAVFYYSLARGK